MSGAVRAGLGGMQNLADVAAFEAASVESRDLPASTYEFLLRGCRLAPDRTAITYFHRGAEHAPELVSWRSRAAHALMSLRGERCAAPVVKYSFQDVERYVTRTANLLHHIGVGPGDVVSVLLPNLPEMHFVLWGAEAAGIVNPINPMLEPAVIAEIMQAAGTRVLVTLGELPGSDLWRKVQGVVERVGSLQHILLVHGRGACRLPLTRYWPVVHGYPADRLESGRRICADDVASLFHTGGTTGLPKLAQHTHRNEVTMCWITYASGPDYRDGTALVGLPLFHANAALGTGLGALASGVPIVLAGPQGFRTPGVIENFFAIANRYRVTWFSAVPTILAALETKGRVTSAPTSIRWAAIGAAPCPVELHHGFERRTGIRLVAVYGLTEGTLLTTRAPADSDARIGSCGIRLPHVQLRVFRQDDDGSVRTCGPDEVGIVAQAGPTVFPGYLDSAHDRSLWLTDADGQRWLNTGDLGRIDRDGYLWLTGRAKELIIRGGHNIDPGLIEAALCEHQDVQLAAAVGRPDVYAGEVPVAYVSLKAGANATAAELLEFASHAIPERAAVPKEVVVLETLPTTAVGKIYKPELARREIERACRVEIASLDSRIARAEVSVDADRQRGWVSRIRVRACAGCSPDEARSSLGARLGRYTFHWQLEVDDA